MFWSSFLVTILAGVLIVRVANIGQNAGQDSNAFFMTGMLIVFTGPVWQLGACVIAALQIAVRIDPSLRAGYWRHLGNITLGIVAGEGLGFLLMWLYSHT